MTRGVSLSAEQRAMVVRASPRIRRLAASVARRNRVYDPEDLAQLAMVKVVELAAAYDPIGGATFDTFVFRTAKRVMVDACRAERRERTVCRLAQKKRPPVDLSTNERDLLAADALVEMFSEPETPEGLLVREQERELLNTRVHAALVRLNARNRTLVSACACDGTPLTSVARTLGLTYSKARYALSVAMANVGRWLRAAA